MSAHPTMAAVAAVVVVLLVAAAGSDRLPACRTPNRLRQPPRRLPFQRHHGPATARELATWCELAARDLRAGTSLPVAIERAGEALPVAGAAFTPAIEALHRGRPLIAALERIDTAAGHQIAVVVPVLRATAELGGPAAPPLERVAATLHARADAESERWAHSAQARLSARVLTVLPVGVLALLGIADVSIRRAATSPVGATCLLAGALLNVAGWWWMRRVIGDPA